LSFFSSAFMRRVASSISSVTSCTPPAPHSRARGRFYAACCCCMGQCTRYEEPD
jgi:hypothetical protein